MTMMHYAVMCNYFWLLIEAVYLQTILVLPMTEQPHFSNYMALGWGKHCFSYKHIEVLVLYMSRVYKLQYNKVGFEQTLQFETR